MNIYNHDFLVDNPFLESGAVRPLEALGGLMMSSYDEGNNADVLLCCGSQEFYRSIAETAADIYHNNNGVNHVIVSGQPTVELLGVSEACAMQNLLIAGGVPANKILVEDRATNSQENVLFSKRLLEAHYPEQYHASVMGVGRRSSAYRFMATLVENWPNANIYFKAANDFDNVCPSCWDQDPTISKYIWKEVEKVVKYADAGFISKDFANAVSSICSQAIDSGVKIPKKIVKELRL